MATPKSIHQQVLEALRAKLAAIPGTPDDWHYAADQAVIVDAFLKEYLSTNFSMLYLIRADEEYTVEKTSGTVNRVAVFYILGAHIHSPSSTNPFDADQPLRIEVANRIVRDVERAIAIDCQLAGVAGVINCQVTDVNRTVFVDGWAVADLRVEVEYDTLAGTP